MDTKSVKRSSEGKDAVGGKSRTGGSMPSWGEGGWLPEVCARCFRHNKFRSLSVS